MPSVYCPLCVLPLFFLPVSVLSPSFISFCPPSFPLYTMPSLPIFPLFRLPLSTCFLLLDLIFFFCSFLL